MLKILLADWSRAEIRATSIRQEVFIEEQLVPEADEWGHGDERALHLIASLDGNPIATARLMPDGTIGRMAVLKSYRNQGTGSAMMEKLIETAKRNNFEALKLNAQRTAESFYAKHGFIAGGNEFTEAGILHIEMHLKLK
jgi:predicted GNAT family N-acyltransferase